MLHEAQSSCELTAAITQLSNAARAGEDTLAALSLAKTTLPSSQVCEAIRQSQPSTAGIDDLVKLLCLLYIYQHAIQREAALHNHQYNIL